MCLTAHDIYSQPPQLQTSLHCVRLLIDVASSYIFLNGCAACKTFAPYRPIASVASLLVSPNGAANIFALLSVSAYICQQIFYKTV